MDLALPGGDLANHRSPDFLRRLPLQARQLAQALGRADRGRTAPDHLDGLIHALLGDHRRRLRFWRRTFL